MRSHSLRLHRMAVRWMHDRWASCGPPSVNTFVDESSKSSSFINMGTLAGFSGLRADLLVALRKEQPLTATELGTRFGLTPNALRRHLKTLQDAGLVRFTRVVRGVGGPGYEYSLTEQGEQLFPRAYANPLADALESCAPSRGARAWCRSSAVAGKRSREEAAPTLADLSFAERARALAAMLTANGYMAESESPSPTRDAHSRAQLRRARDRAALSRSVPRGSGLHRRGPRRARRAPVAHDARLQRVRVHRHQESGMSSSIESLVNKEYQYGFVTDVESDTIAPGLTEDTVRLISAKKDEPDWLLEWRLKAFRRWQAMTEPHWSNLKYASDRLPGAALLLGAQERRRRCSRSTRSIPSCSRRTTSSASRSASRSCSPASPSTRSSTPSPSARP